MKLSVRQLPIGACAVVVLSSVLAGCGGGGSSSPTPNPNGTPPPAILVNGATYQYAGTESVAITYTNPTATNVNSNGAYTYTTTQTVSNSASGAPAAFDVNRATTYTVTQQPASGDQLQSATSDTFENQSFAGATETITTVASKSTATNIDLNAGLRLGSGPFTQITNGTTTYVTPQLDQIYPLQTGFATTDQQARSTTSVVTDTNGGGVYGGGGTTTTTFNGDGSYTRSIQAGDGSSTQQQSVNANGTATNTVTNNANGTVTQTAISAPSGSGASATIPVTVTTNGNAVSSSALDWYPNGLVSLPLAITTRTVKGPVALPSSCNFHGTASNIVEIDSAGMTLNLLGSSSVSSAQTFNNNGVEICRMSTTTSTNYALTTGLPTLTNVTSFSETLQSSNQTIAGLQRRSP